MYLSNLTKFASSRSLEAKYSLIIRNRLKQIRVDQESERLRSSKRYQDPKCLIPFGDKTYSQTDEDGIFREIFNRVGVTNKTFVEFGSGSGLENNTLALLFEHWQGLWIDASSRSIKKINKHFSKIIEGGKLKVIQSFVTKSNINQFQQTSERAKSIYFR